MIEPIEPTDSVFKTMNCTIVDLRKMDCGIHVARI